MVQGIIYRTSYRVDSRDGNRSNERGNFTGIQNQPETIQPIEGFNASKYFYTYGFDWYPNRIVWWILHPVTEEKIVLWDYTGSTPNFTGIPPNHSRYRVNFWHTNDWSVTTNPNSLERPLYPYEVEIEWISYTPLMNLYYV